MTESWEKQVVSQTLGLDQMWCEGRFFHPRNEPQGPQILPLDGQLSYVVHRRSDHHHLTSFALDNVLRGKCETNQEMHSGPSYPPVEEFRCRRLPKHARVAHSWRTSGIFTDSPVAPILGRA